MHQELQLWQIMNKGVIILLLVATVDRIILQGIYPVLPVMIADMGLPPGYNSMFMAITYVSIALGSYLTPRIMGYFSSVSKLSVFISLLTAIALWGMGSSSGYWSFLVATCLYWLLSGVQINIYSIVMSYISPPHKIGSNFGLLANTTLVGAVLGSFVLGPFIQELGLFYSFLVFGIVSVVFRFLLFFAEYDSISAQQAATDTDFKISNKLWVLLITFNAGIMLSFIGRFNLSLIMKEQHYSIEYISYVFAWGALIVFPLPYLFGRLSERISNKLLLVISLLSVVIAMAILYRTTTYFGFLSVSFLICIMTYCSRGVTQKILYDMYPISQQKHAQSVLSSANWVAAILGFVSVSVTSGWFSLQQVSLYGCVAGIASVLVLFFSKFGRA